MRFDAGLKTAATGGVFLLAFLLVNAWVAERNLQDIISASNQSGHTSRVLTALRRTLSTVQDAETGQRGYILTGDRAYLAPYTGSLSQLPTELDALQSVLTPGKQQDRLVSLRGEIALKAAELKKTIDLYDAGRQDDALQVIRSAHGLQHMAEIRRTIEQMSNEEQSIFDGKRFALEASWQRARGTNVLATAIGVSLLATLALAFVRRARQSEQIELERRRSEARFREMADNLPLIVSSLDSNGRVLFANKFFFEYTGAKANGELGDLVASTVLAEDRPKLILLWEQARREGAEFSAEVRICRYDAEHRWFEIRYVPFRSEGGAIDGWFGVGIDVHDERVEQERLALAVAQRTSQLTEANRDLEGFTYSVSHDLRAPLRAIASTSHMLIEDYGDTIPSDANALLLRQAAAATKLGQLIDDLLHLTRISRIEMRREPLDLSLMAREIVDGLRSNGSHRFEIQPDLHATGDSQLIRLALDNLFLNAVKFSPGGGSIEFGKAETSRGPAFYLRDHGVGFDMAYAHKLFKPFERLVTEQEFPGTGIGLTNVQRAIERHGGEVWAESELGHGATFYFTLAPRVSGPAERLTASDAFSRRQ